MLEHELNSESSSETPEDSRPAEVAGEPAPPRATRRRSGGARGAASAGADTGRAGDGAAGSGGEAAGETAGGASSGRRTRRTRATRATADGAGDSGEAATGGGAAETGTADTGAAQAGAAQAGAGEAGAGEAGSGGRPATRRRRGASREAGPPADTAGAPAAAGAAAQAGGSPATPPSGPFAGPFGAQPPPAQSQAAGTPAQGQEGPPGVPLPTFQPPQVLFQPPAAASGGDGEGEDAGRRRGGRARGEGEAERRGQAEAGEPAAQPGQAAAEDEDGAEREDGRKRRRRGRGRGREGADGEQAAEAAEAAPEAGEAEAAEEGDEDKGEAGSRRRRRRRRRGTGGDAEQGTTDDPPNTVVHIRVPRKTAAEDGGGADEVQSVRGSTRLEAKRQRRREGRESGRRRPPVITESEFLARREAVDRVMVVRQQGERTQIGVLEDGVLVEHYVDKSSHQSLVGNVYLGKVQNVLPSMEAAFVDIGKGRNAVLYAGEVNFDASGLEGESKRIESALKSGQSVLVQVTKDPVGHKGARLTSQVSLPGRYLVYVPGGSMMGISRKLPDKERTRLKQILKQVMPEGAGVIVRTAAEGAAEDELAHDVARLSAQWESIEQKAKTASAPELLYSEPDLTIRVVRDIFNEDFSSLVVAGEDSWDLVDEYVRYVAPNLSGRLSHWQDDGDVFGRYRIDEQLAKALDRKVWLPSGGSLVIDKTEAMTVIDVNTGKFTGQGGNLEQTVTRNNLEAAEEIVRQLRLRDVGGIIVIDFIDMVLESNRDLVLRRLLECLARDRTKHQVAEVTSLGLVQMTRKRVGSGLLEAFSQPCDCCNGRGVLVSMDLDDGAAAGHRGGRGGRDDRQSGGRRGKNGKGGDREGGGRNGAAPDGGRAAPAAAGGAEAEAASTDAAPAGPADSGGQAPEPGAEPAAEPAATAGPAAGKAGQAGGGDAQAAGTGRAAGEGQDHRSRGRRRAATREQGAPAPAYQALSGANGAAGAGDPATGTTQDAGGPADRASVPAAGEAAPAAPADQGGAPAGSEAVPAGPDQASAPAAGEAGQASVAAEPATGEAGGADRGSAAQQGAAGSEPAGTAPGMGWERLGSPDAGPASAGWQGTVFGGAGDGLGVAAATTGVGGTAGFGVPTGDSGAAGADAFTAPVGWADVNGETAAAGDAAADRPDQPGNGGPEQAWQIPGQQTLDEAVTDRGQDAGPGDGEGFQPPAAG
ncbi:MAG: Rne/Rng family ribonuclease [Gemmatimonadota bacterium]